MILVSGATGFIGSHLVCFLAQKQLAVRALYRDEKKFDRVKRVFSYYDSVHLFDTIEWVKADINDVVGLETAFSGVRVVYHAAALVSFDSSRFDVLKKVNIEGTANMVNLSIKHGVEKFCHVSTVAALGDSATAVDEETHWNPEEDNHVYGITKYGAEMEVWRGTQEGLKVVVVNPSIVLGAGFWSSGSGKLFSSVAKGLSFYPPGSMGFVDVEDVVKIMISLMERDIVNERFLISAENRSYKSVLDSIAKNLDGKPPTLKAGKGLLHILRILDVIKHSLTGKPRSLFKPSIRSAVKQHTYSSDKVRDTLSYHFKPIDKSLESICLRYAAECKGDRK
ncbi:MAG: NAD-dependent epimerase/dehydratase family protein [Bacteroidetes bacterium]|nr:NAD-dependent epimerase/dehydratase family protein [Bacteroidota bacterium]